MGKYRRAAVALDYSKGLISLQEITDDTGVNHGELLMFLGLQGLRIPKKKFESRPEQIASLDRLFNMRERRRYDLPKSVFMTEKLRGVRVIIPDTGILISLARGNILDALVGFEEQVDLVITDVVEFEYARNADVFDAKKIHFFLTQNSSQISVEPTGFHEYIVAAKANPETPNIPDICELSIYGLINSTSSDTSKIPTLILLQDTWFMKNQAYRPASSTQLLSLANFLKYIEQDGFSFPS